MLRDILTAPEVADYLRISLSTLKRWNALARRGEFDFPLALSPKGYQLKWRRSDIEIWRSRIGKQEAQS